MKTSVQFSRGNTETDPSTHSIRQLLSFLPWSQATQDISWSLTFPRSRAESLFQSLLPSAADSCGFKAAEGSCSSPQHHTLSLDLSVSSQPSQFREYCDLRSKYCFLTQSNVTRFSNTQSIHTKNQNAFIGFEMFTGWACHK